ncbi:MAG: transporter substrate-binding domain-containing protein [Salinivirgaceae bacterium]|nr:transporter substrate-binding domain-containing protein [Salinivirgaceae bacterium]
MRLLRKISVLISAALLFCACGSKTPNAAIEGHDLPEITQRGKLIATTDYNSISYFIYRGTLMGYQYELLRDFANSLNLDLEVKVSNNLENDFEELANHETDIIAINLTVTADRQKQMNFTMPIMQTRQVLVQLSERQRQRNNRNYKGEMHIKSTLDMAGKTIHVVKNSAFAERLHNIESEIGDTINIVEVENIDSEQLIEQVAKGEIDYCVTDEDVAMINQTYYPVLDIATAVSFPQNMAWAVSKDNPQLLEAANNWIAGMRNSAFHMVLYKKYFKDPKTLTRAQSPYQSFRGGSISKYDDIIKKYSKQIDWDWRLLASLIYQESRFNENARSWCGAFGLMQLMPETAQHFGIDTTASAEANIKAGVKFIKWLNKQLKDSVANEEERVKFILASYNIGLGHVLDARRVARANGGNPDVWDGDGNVDFFLRHKSDKLYYNPELVRTGYCRGDETHNFVRDIIERYNIYKTLIK